MAIIWTKTAYDDLDRLYQFLAVVNPKAAAKTVQALSAVPENIQPTPAIGLSLPQYAPRNVRRYLVGDYEMRYELIGHDIHILTIWHQREKR